MRLVQWLFVIGAALFVFGIGFVVVGARAARERPAVTESLPITPVASIKQIMNGIVNPAATTVFDSVAVTVSATGTEEKMPRNDAEWAAVGDAAATLAEAGNLMLMDGHRVDRDAWTTMSMALVDAARQTLKAVEAKSVEGMFEAGSVVYTSCDTCHQRYQRQ